METLVRDVKNMEIGLLVTGKPVGEVYLLPGTVMRLEGDRRGTQIACAAGTLWITQSGDQQDYLLQPGERFVISRRGLVLVQGLPEGEAHISPAAG